MFRRILKKYRFKYIVSLFFMICIMYSCQSLKKSTTNHIYLPSLAIIGKLNSKPFNKNFIKYGEPELTTPIALAIEEIPFDQKSFNKFKAIESKKGRKVPFIFNDTMPLKLNYYQFKIKDKIGLRNQLNNAENKTSRSFIATNASYEIVTSVSVFMNGSIAKKYMNAEGVFLSKNENNILELSVFDNSSESYAKLPTQEVFDYETMRFCWGDNLGKTQIITFRDSCKCPKGTEKKIKESDNFSFLKL